MPPLACCLCKTKPWSWPELILSIVPYETYFNEILIWNSKFFIERNTLEIVTWEMSARLSLPQCVKRSILYVAVSHRNDIYLVPVEWHKTMLESTHCHYRIGLEISAKALTHWGGVTHICVGKLTIIGSDNGLSPGRRQAIIWTNVGILLIGHLGTNFSEILIGIQTFSFKKTPLKMSSAKWLPFCLGLNVLMLLSQIPAWMCSQWLHTL